MSDKIEDAKPKEGEVCVFSNQEDFSNWIVAKYLYFKDQYYFTNKTLAFKYCKPFDPDNLPWS